MKKFDSILVVDGDPISNYMVLNFFTRLRVTNELHFCRNGKEALSFIDFNQKPELILLEVYTPVMDGFEFLDMLNRKGISTSQVIFYTTHTKEAFTGYNYEVIDKPLTYEKFTNALKCTVEK